MRKRIVLLLALSTVFGACAYSGHLVPEPMEGTPANPGMRSGYVPYRNDSKAERRKDDALRKIAKYCGSDGYTVTREVPSAQEVQIGFTCGSVPASAAAPSPASAAPVAAASSPGPVTSTPAASATAAVSSPGAVPTQSGSSWAPPAQN